MNTRRRFLSIVFGLGLGLGAVENTMAQTYPNRLVTLVVPGPAGSDTVCRLLADKLRTILGQQLIVENRPGAGGTIGAEFAARAAPDGHVLLCANEYVYFSHLTYQKLAFDPQAFEPVSVLATFQGILVGRADLPANNLAELIAYARTHPGKLNYASAGVGSMPQLVLEAIKLRAGIDLVHVPYRGGAPALNDLIAGQVDVYFTSAVQGIPQIKAGKLKLLAVASRTRLADFPDVATIAEVLPGLEMEGWTAIAAPPRTSNDITRKLSEVIAKAMQMPDFRARILDAQAEPFGSRPEEMRATIQ